MRLNIIVLLTMQHFDWKQAMPAYKGHISTYLHTIYIYIPMHQQVIIFDFWNFITLNSIYLQAPAHNYYIHEIRDNRVNTKGNSYIQYMKCDHCENV